VNCFTTKYNRLAPKLWHTVFTKDRKQQETITTVKRNINVKLQVSNGEIHFTR